eukprot:2550419-Amphidinium_carterae.1
MFLGKDAVVKWSELDDPLIPLNSVLMKRRLSIWKLLCRGSLLMTKVQWPMIELLLMRGIFVNDAAYLRS